MMTEDAERVKQEVIQLPESDRAELAHLLIESLDEIEEADVQAAWGMEVEGRLRRIEEGKSHSRPAYDVLAEIRDRYR